MLSVTIFILSASVILQLAAVVLGIRLIRISGRFAAWLVLASAFFVQLARRGYTLYSFLSGGFAHPPDLVSESTGLLISLLMVIGIAAIAPVIRSLRTIDNKISESEIKYSSLFENLQEGFQVIGFDWKYLLLNDAVAGQGQKKKEEMLGRTMMEMYPGIEKTAMFAELERCMETKAPHRMENEFAYPDGSKGWFELNIFAVPEGVAILSQDITERKRAEATLRENEERYHTVTDYTYDWEYWQAPDGKFIFVSPSCERVTGYTAEEFYNDPELPVKLAHPDDKDRLAAHIHKSGTPQDEPERHDLDFRIITRSGEERWIAHSCLRVFGRDGQYMGRRASNRDITERKLSEKAIRESEQKFHNTITSLDEGYYSCTMDGVLLDHNPAFNRILGFDAARDLKGSKLPDFWQDPDDRKQYLNNLMAEGFIRNYLINAKTVGGEKIVVMASSHLVKDGTGQPVRIDGIYTDFTERKRAEEELQEKNDEMTRFTYTASHDLKSPLVSIITFLGFLEQDIKKADSEAISKDMGYIHAAADKMSLLLSELLNLSRIGRKTNSPVEIPLKDAVKEAMDLVAGQLSIRGVKVTVTEKPVMLYGDRQRLIEIFQNLIDNAVKFMGEQAAPRVEIGLVEGRVPPEIFVRDNGIGIDPRYHHKLFGLFEKLDSSTDGTGIGLALVKRIVEVHGGKIRVESEGPGKGAAFFFTLAKTV